MMIFHLLPVQFLVLQACLLVVSSSSISKKLRHFPKHNQDARQPANMDKFPPPIIADVCYGCAAVLQWVSPGLFHAISSPAKSLYYDTAGSEDENSSGMNDLNTGDDTEEGHWIQPKEENPPTAYKPRSGLIEIAPRLRCARAG